MAALYPCLLFVYVLINIASVVGVYCLGLDGRQSIKTWYTSPLVEYHSTEQRAIVITSDMSEKLGPLLFHVPYDSIMLAIQKNPLTEISESANYIFIIDEQEPSSYHGDIVKYLDRNQYEWKQQVDIGDTPRFQLYAK